MVRYEVRWPARRSIRMPAHDYAEPGDYFITLVTKNRECLFDLPQNRAVVEDAWMWLERRYRYVELDEFVIMPNHLHGIVTLIGDDAGGSRAAPTESVRRKPLGELVGAFKTVSTKSINALRGTPGQPLWQRNFYEHVMRTERDLESTRAYILGNTQMWPGDPENPAPLVASQTSVNRNAGDERTQ